MVQDDYVPLDLLELIMNEMGRLLNIKDQLFLNGAAANPELFTTANEIEFFTSYDYGLFEKLIKDFNAVLKDLKQDDNLNYEEDLNKLQEIQNKIIEESKSFEDSAFKVGLVRDNFDKESIDEPWSKLYDYVFGELSTKFKNLTLLNNLFINSLKDKTKKRSGIKLLVPKIIMPKSDNPDDYGAVIDYLKSNYKKDIKQQVPNINQISKLNDSTKKKLHELEETKEFYIDQIINKLNEVKKIMHTGTI